MKDYFTTWRRSRNITTVYSGRTNYRRTTRRANRFITFPHETKPIVNNAKIETTLILFFILFETPYRTIIPCAKTQGIN